MHRLARLVSIAVVFLLLAGVAAAQTNDLVNAGIQFNFSSPGARSLGFGGAFLGLADDATTAYTNPAGLTNLSLQEVSLEARYWKFKTEFPDYGNASGEATNNQFGKETCRGEVGDCVDGVVTGESEKSDSGVSFLSYVLPKKNWAIAAYRHELAKYSANFRDQGLFHNSGAPQTNPGRYYPYWAKMNLHIVNWGVSGAWRAHERFSLGLGVSVYQFEIDSKARRYNTKPLSDNFLPGGTYGKPDYSDANVVNKIVQSGSDTALGVNFGFLWKASEVVSLGGVYRQGPKFDYKSVTTRTSSDEVTRLKPVFDLPDVFGLGLTIRPTQELTIAFDLDRVRYSQLADKILDWSGNPAIEPRDFKVDDGTELHLGLEYVFFAGQVGIPVRLGAWRDPAHRMYYEGSILSLQPYFKKGDNETHITGGIGIIKGTKFQVDAAYDHSEFNTTASLSAVWRF